MDKYTLLVVLNLPFVIFGLIRAFNSYKAGSIKLVGFFVRVLFWLGIFGGLIFAQQIYNFFLSRQLTDTTPLSLADVVEITGIILCFSLILRLYSKIDKNERLLTDMHEKLSIELSKKTKT